MIELQESKYRLFFSLPDVSAYRGAAHSHLVATTVYRVWQVVAVDAVQASVAKPNFPVHEMQVSGLVEMSRACPVKQSHRPFERAMPGAL